MARSLCYYGRSAKAIRVPICGILAVVACAVGAAPARAGGAVVLLVPRDRPEAARGLREAVAAQLSDADVKLRVEAVAALPAEGGCGGPVARARAGRSGVVAVLWLDPRAQRVCLVLAPSRGGRVVSRRVGGTGPEARHEAVAVLVRTALAGGDGADPGGRPGGKGPRGLVAARPLLRPGVARLELELAYGLEVLATEAGVATLAHGLWLGVQVRLHRHWTLFAGYRLESRVEVDDTDGSVELQRYPVDAGIRFRWWRGALELGARLGLGFAYSRLLQRLPSTSSNAVRATSDWLVFLGAYGYVGFRPVARLLLFAAVGARAYPLNARYQLASGEVVLKPWPVQPSFQLGLGVDLF